MYPRDCSYIRPEPPNYKSLTLQDVLMTYCELDDEKFTEDVMLRLIEAEKAHRLLLDSELFERTIPVTPHRQRNVQSKSGRSSSSGCCVTVTLKQSHKAVVKAREKTLVALLRILFFPTPVMALTWVFFYFTT